MSCQTVVDVSSFCMCMVCIINRLFVFPQNPHTEAYPPLQRHQEMRILEVIRLWGWSPREGFMSLWEETRTLPSLSSPPVRIWQGQAHLQTGRWTLNLHQTCCHLNLGFPGLQSREGSVHVWVTRYGALLQQANPRMGKLRPDSRACSPGVSNRQPKGQMQDKMFLWIRFYGT